MGVGLSKNSPVQLSLSRENYEALLARHGQWIRWRIAQKCACVNGPTFAPNIHCKLCGGRGFTYTYQQKQLIQTIVMAPDDTGLIQLDDEFKCDRLVKAYDYQGREFTDAEKFDSFVDLKITTHKGIYYNLILERDNVKKVEEVEIVKTAGNNYYEIPQLTVSRPNIDGVYYSAPCDIVKVGKITDANGLEFQVEQLRLNKILLADREEVVEDEDGNKELQIIEPALPLSAEYVEYVEPFIFALLNQNLNKGDQQALVDYQGDAVCTFPYTCDVAEQDVLTVLAGTITQKEVLCRTEDKYDVLSAYFVDSIVSIIDNEGKEKIQGIDYELVGTNQIKWLDEDTEPEAGDGYSVTYKVCPTYVVMQNIPQLRSSENQRFPKKAVVKLNSSYSEKKKVNRQ